MSRYTSSANQSIDCRNGRPNSSISQNKSSIKMFCSVCKNAGKPENVYTAHFTKSSSGPSGVVICPTILSTECTYCHEIGHFKNACPKLELKKTGSIKPEQVQAKPRIVNKSEDVKIFRTKFASAFGSDSDDSDNGTIRNKPKEDFPSIGNVNRNYANIPQGNSWARTASALPVPKKVVYQPKKLSLINPDLLNDETYVYKPIVINCKYNINHDWADDSYWGNDSDDE
jgi:hypothetical protein